MIQNIKLALKIAEKDVEFVDGYAGNNQCRDIFCGHYAFFDNVSFKRSVCRTTKYMKKMKNSTQYKEPVEKLNK